MSAPTISATPRQDVTAPDRRSGVPRPKVRLTQQGWYYALVLMLVFAAAMLREVNLLLILAGMLAGPLVFNWRLASAGLRQLSVRRKMPREVCAGDLLVVALELTNARRRMASWAVELEDRVCAASSGHSHEVLRPSVLVAHVPAGQTRSVVYRVRLPRRGVYRFGPVRISSRFPFGLFSGTVQSDEIDTVWVFPRLGRLTPGWIARRWESFEGASRREHRHSRVPGEFFGVRTWRHGDSPRWVHWRSSARHDKLVVRQFEQHRNRDVAVLVDLWQPRRPGPQDLDTVELAVSFAATVVTQVCRKGGSNLLLGVPGSQPVCVSGPASAGMLQAAMEHLALAEASPEDRLSQLLEAALAQITPGTDVVLVSTRRVDVAELGRLGAQGADAGRRAVLRRIRVVNAATEELDAYFQA